MELDEAIPVSATTTTGFDQHYFARPLSKNHLEAGNKVVMPASAFNQLASQSIVYPMLFRVEKVTTAQFSHCGVVEFSGDEGSVLLPTWMMKNMNIQEGNLVNIKYASLPKGEYIKIQSHATKFINLSDHKSLLEKAFRDFACLTTGDTIEINYAGEKYLINILETKPSQAISLFETDCEVDFATPLDHQEPEKKTCVYGKRKSTSSDDEDRRTCPRDVDDSKLFPGQGRRLGGTVIMPRDDYTFNQSMKRMKITEATTTKKVDGKMKRKLATEFKPFSGVPRHAKSEPLVPMVAKDGEHDQPKVPVKVKVEEQKGFQAFTGKSFRLM